MKKKILSIILAGTMVSSVVAAGSIAVHAEDGELAPGGYGTLGEYTPNAGVKTNHLMFAMPRAWQNDTTKNEKCGGAAGIYWWSGYQTPDDVAGGHGWPGYKAVQVKEEGVDNLWAIDVPTYHNGEKGNATAIIWNNYLDGGMETDPVKNPFYDAAVQTRDFPGQYYSRIEENETYELLFRYAYKKAMKQANVGKPAGVFDFAIFIAWCLHTENRLKVTGRRSREGARQIECCGPFRNTYACCKLSAGQGDSITITTGFLYSCSDFLQSLVLTLLILKKEAFEKGVIFEVCIHFELRKNDRLFSRP